MSTSTNLNTIVTTGKYCTTPSQATNPLSTRGIVTTPNYLASQSGLEVLRKGGNAIDAAIAAGTTLAVVYPQMCTLGADSFWLIYNAKTGEIKALNASGRSGEKADIDFYKKQGLEKIPPRGYLSANTVPGVVSGWDEAFKYSRSEMKSSMEWGELFSSAIDYAHSGFPVGTSLAHWIQVDIDPNDQEYHNLQRFAGFRNTYLKDGGKPYRTGDIMKLPALAKTLRLLADKGADEFYKGSIAKDIVADLANNGGLLTLADFAEHKADWVEPISVNYRDCKAYNFPPNSQGMASLEILNILNNFDLKKIGDNTADYYHLVAEAIKEAFIDRDRYLSDPDFVKIPLDFLLSPEHGKDQAARIKMDKASGPLPPLDPKGDTTWFGVVDSEGNAASLIQSVYYDFGSGIVDEKTGILLQNRGSFFSLDSKQANCLQPRKRCFHTLNPAMLTKNDKPYVLYGTQGGEGQPQTQTSVITRIIDFGLSPQDAVNAPRWLYGRGWGTDSNDFKIEGRVPDSVIEDLRKRGHTMRKLEDFTDVMGHAGAILIHQETGDTPRLLQGASDPRGDGLAAAY